MAERSQMGSGEAAAKKLFLPSDEGLDLLWVPLPSPLRPSFA